MKKISISILFVAALFCACNNSGNSTGEVSALTDSTIVDEPLVSEEVAQMVDIVNSVAACLDSIQLQENMIFKADESTPKDQIIMRMKAFQELLSRKQAQINQLSGKNKSNKLAMANLQKMVEYLQQQLTEKSEQIAKLEDAVQNKDMKISELRYDMNELEQRSDYLEDQNVAQDQQLNEVYFIVGEKKELNDLGLLKGGFLSKKKADYANLDKSKFTKRDMRGLEKLTIESKNPKLITEKPASSYTLTKNDDGTTTLEIKDPQTFWSVSPFLIIQK
jgi:alpha-glucosidase (family GH31 glycosyl hydrolase)